MQLECGASQWFHRRATRYNALVVHPNGPTKKSSAEIPQTKVINSFNSNVVHPSGPTDETEPVHPSRPSAHVSVSLRTKSDTFIMSKRKHDDTSSGATGSSTWNDGRGFIIIHRGARRPLI